MAPDAGVLIRPATPEDADALLALQRALDSETTFMMLEPGERTVTPELLARHLEEVGRTANSMILVAERAGHLVGYLEADGGTSRRNRHSAYVVIGVLQAAAGRGLGTALLDALETWARSHGMHRLELTVMAHNERARALYARCGYEVEGTRRHSLRVGNDFIDELAMAKLL